MQVDGVAEQSVESDIYPTSIRSVTSALSTVYEETTKGRTCLKARYECRVWVLFPWRSSAKSDLHIKWHKLTENDIASCFLRSALTLNNHHLMAFDIITIPLFSNTFLLCSFFIYFLRHNFQYYAVVYVDIICIFFFSLDSPYFSHR